nr:MAG: ORF2 [Torque teno polar bear virus 31]
MLRVPLSHSTLVLPLSTKTSSPYRESPSVSTKSRSKHTAATISSSVGSSAAETPPSTGAPCRGGISPWGCSTRNTSCSGTGGPTPTWDTTWPATSGPNSDSGPTRG